LALLKVVPYGNSLLRRQSAPVEQIDDDILSLIEDMKDTMKVAGGVGLAAPQVGESRMLFLIDWSEIEEGAEISAYINPEIIERGNKLEIKQEGCLSLPEIWADVNRQDWIRVRYETIDGEKQKEELTGLPARVFQHEYDHLVGILFIDRISSLERAQIKDKLQAIMDGRVKAFNPSNVTETTLNE